MSVENEGVETPEAVAEGAEGQEAEANDPMLAEDIAAADEELDEVYDDEEEGTIGAYISVVAQMLSDMDDHQGDVISVVNDMRASDDDDDYIGSELDTATVDSSTGVVERTIADLTAQSMSFLRRLGVAVDPNLSPRGAVLNEAHGTTADGETVEVVHNKKRTAIRLHVGKRKVREENAVAVLRRLVNSGRAELDELSMTFVDETEDEDERAEDVTLTAGDPASCRALLLSATPTPTTWIWRDFETMCGELMSSLELVPQIAESYLTLVSGGVRCVLLEGAGESARVVGLQRWIFRNGQIVSLLWEDGGNRPSSETMDVVTSADMLRQMYAMRTEGWSRFEMLPNLDAVASYREGEHLTEEGNFRAKIKAVPHNVDNYVVAESSIDDDVGFITSVSGLWNVIREHLTAAFEEQAMGPMEVLSNYKDVIDNTLTEAVEIAGGVVKNELMTRTVEQFDSVVEPDLAEPEEDEDDLDDENLELADGPATLGSERATRDLENLREALTGGAPDDQEAEDATTPQVNVGRASSRRRRGGVPGTTRRSRV